MTTTTIRSSTSNPMYTHTLTEFINAYNNRSVVPIYESYCYQQQSGNIKYVVKNVLDDYMYELKKLAINIELTNDEIVKYNYKPKLLSADIYGLTDFYYIILLLNGICDVKQFHDINPIKLISSTDLGNYLSSITTNESVNIKKFNSSH
jgi:hypothetical protein